MSQPEAFSVYARFRPTNEREARLGAKPCTDNLTENAVVMEGHTYSFDGVFDHTTDQITMYNAIGKNHIKYVLDGFNSTIFAYGQTSSGKTHTMEGPKILELNENTMGLIPRIFRALDEAQQVNQENFEITIEMSMLEIYMEKVNDLLDPSKENLQIRGATKTGFYVQDLTRKKVLTERDMIHLYQIGCKNRTTAATTMNDRSSRSHSVLLLNIQKRDKSDGKISTSVFSLVDLAGSEKFEASGDDEHRREEGKKINQSLTTLGKVIKALTENMKAKKDDYVPYRESVLTKLLKQSLSGNCLTSLILCCSPAICNKEETISTLRFGERAKLIKHEVYKNIIPSVHELQNVINQLKRKLREYEGGDIKIGIKEGGEGENADYLSKEEAYEEEIKLLNEKLTDYNEKHENDLTKIKNLEEEKAKLLASFPDKDSYEDRIKELERKIELLTEELRKSHEENNKLKMEIGNLKRENTSLREENENLKNKSENTINQLNYDKKNAEKKVEELQLNISNLQQQIELKNKEYQEKMLEIQNEFSIQNFAGTLTNSQITRFDNDDLTEGNVVNKLKKFLEENQKTINENRQTIESLTKEKINLENRIKEVEKDASETKNMLLENYEEIIVKLKDDNKKNMNSLHEEIDKLTNDLTYYKQNYESKCVEIESMEKSNIENINRIKRQFRTRNIDTANQRETNYPLSKTMILNNNENRSDLLISNDFIPTTAMKNLAAINKEKAKLEEEVRQLNEELTNLDNRNGELEKEISELKKNVNNNIGLPDLESVKNMELIIDQLESEKEKLNDINVKLSRENNELKKENPTLQNEIDKLKKQNSELIESLNKEKDRENAFIEADYTEKYNKLIQENQNLKQKCEDLSRLKDGLTNEFNSQIELLYSKGLLQENEYRKLQNTFLSVEENFTAISSYLSFDYEHFNILSYINGSQVSLFTGHQAPLYNPKPDRARELMIEDFAYDYSIYFPSSINSNMIKESDMENIRNNDNLKDKCLEMIIMFLSIVGLRLEKQKSSFDLYNNKNNTIICRRMNSSALVEDKLRHLCEYEYEIVITQIFRHLRETNQHLIQNVLINYLVNEINIQCGPLNCKIVRNVFHDSWVSLIADDEVRTNLEQLVSK